MDKICKAYVSQVKAILPLWGKKEKALIRKLRSDLYDYCEYNNINTILQKIINNSDSLSINNTFQDIYFINL